MEDFREIVGFLIIGIGILLSVLKERKGNKSSDNSAPAQNNPIERKPINQHPQATEPARPITRPAQQASPVGARSLPFVVSSVAERVRQKHGQASSQRTSAYSSESPSAPSSIPSSAAEPNAYAGLPEEGARVTKDVPSMEPISDYNAVEEEQFIEKLREGIILSEILKRKF